jgi:hypothetical protein
VTGAVVVVGLAVVVVDGVEPQPETTISKDIKGTTTNPDKKSDDCLRDVPISPLLYDVLPNPPFILY